MASFENSLGSDEWLSGREIYTGEFVGIHSHRRGCDWGLDFFYRFFFTFVRRNGPSNQQGRTQRESHRFSASGAESSFHSWHSLSCAAGLRSNAQTNSSCNLVGI
jgi:hypothetical protein